MRRLALKAPGRQFLVGSEIEPKHDGGKGDREILLSNRYQPMHCISIEQRERKGHVPSLPS